MKFKHLFLALVVLITKQAYSQEILPVYSDYLSDNYFLLHPSMAGAANCAKLRHTGRQQWFGQEDAPALQTASFNGSISDKDGMGIILLNDKNGYHSQKGFRVAYAHHIMFSRDNIDLNQLSFGVNVGFAQSQLDESTFYTNDPTYDPIVFGQIQKATYYNVDIGASYNFLDFYAHFTVKNALGSDRKLYTDNESVEFELKNPFILTGVTVPGNLSDFLSRIFLLELDEIPEENRQTEQAMNKELDKLLPRIQALVFDCLQEGLARLQYIRTDNLYRLADCHRYSLAMKEILELKGVRLDAVWNKNKSTQNSEASDGDILTEILPKFLNLMDTKHWNGTISDLHEALFNRFSPDQQPWKVKWPKTAMGLSKRLTMLTSALNSVGVTFVRERGSGKRIASPRISRI